MTCFGESYKRYIYFRESVDSSVHFKGYYKIFWWEVPSILKNLLNFAMIVIHIGTLKYPVKNAAERGPVFSKYRVFNIFGIPNKINMSMTINILLYGILGCIVMQEL